MTGKFDEKQVTSPIFEIPKGQKAVSPIYNVEDQINGNDRFVITKDTDGGKYVRGNLIFYKMNGIEVYAELNDAIYIDIINKTAMVRKYKDEEETTTSVDPEERQYTIIIVPYGYEETDNDSMCYWISMQGRTYTYEYIRDNIDSLDLDPARSLVLTDNVKLKDALTVLQFVDYIKNSNMVKEDDFDIHYYLDNEFEEGE